ncbi:hypothetical protein C5167_009685 [Papaver somniferum]|uniref:Knottin scorpion toxin-like domain-containing protein n=1 Tax=Papaver somniferum TaxID=3469 RepID=A0A4Y7JZK4_PAPSO|nr:uncharacterized protein LOC113288292 [Papaver somniferum]RZC65996.1 hypothetical protein C5167_009685 [Papaver somniferum]
MATTKTFSLIGFLLFTSILLQSMNVNAITNACFTFKDHFPIHWSERDSYCGGDLMRWTYSDDVHGDCIQWCLPFHESYGVNCAQINVDEDSKDYCACYQGCP